VGGGCVGGGGGGGGGGVIRGMEDGQTGADVCRMSSQTVSICCENRIEWNSGRELVQRMEKLLSL